jgi:hypothetical protein
MATPLLLIIIAGLLLAVVAWGMRSAQRPASDPDDHLATSTEGMKICARCGMGNLWTGRICSACGGPLRG